MTEKTNKFWEIALKALVPISVMIGSVLIAHEVRISRIESNRFTSIDGERAMSVLREYVRANIAPEWLREDLTEIKQGLRDLGVRMRELEKKK